MPLFRCLTLSLCLFALAACKPESAPPSADAAGAAGAKPDATLSETDAAAVPEAALPAEDLGEFKIVTVLLGKAVDADNVVISDAEVFAGGDTLYASVLSTGAHQGLRLSAKWLAPDGATIAENAQALVPTSATATTFKVSNPERWPAGEYQLLVAVNGRTLQTRKFEVR